MPAPTQEHFTEMINYNLSRYTACQKRYFWVPITKSEQNSSVFVEANQEQNTIDFLPWGYGQPNGNILKLHNKLKSVLIKTSETFLKMLLVTYLFDNLLKFIHF